MQRFEIKKDTPLKKHHKNWQFCVGSGEASLALRSDYVKQLKQVHEELGIERVRFHGIFCDEMDTIHHFSEIYPIPGGEEIMEYTFRKCALAYDNVLECGMRPFVELSFMPTLLAKEDFRGVFFHKPNICMPKDDKQWMEYIKSFVCFLFERYGKEEVESWFFEVWNEPDLQVAFFNGTKEDYFHLYDITVKAIKEVDEKLMVGGPATSRSMWIADFMEHCNKNQIPVDFVTTHQYAGDPLGGIKEQEDGELVVEEDDQISDAEKTASFIELMPKTALLPAYRALMGDPLETEDTQEGVFITNAPMVVKNANGLPVYYTEWNTCATLTAYTNDTRKVAAYDVKTALQLDDVLAGSSIWCFSDIFEEHHQFPEEFHGGFGLMTTQGIKKPVYHALQMLADAGDMKYDLPDELNKEVSVAAFQSQNGVQVLLTRQKLKNYFDLPKEIVDISIELEKKPLVVMIRKIDEEHGNPLKIWEEMGSPQVPTPSQVREIQKVSEVIDEPMDFEYENGIIHIHSALGVNDVYFISIQ